MNCLKNAKLLFQYVTLCSPIVPRRFGRTYCHNFCDRRVSEARNKREACRQPTSPYSSFFFLSPSAPPTASAACRTNVHLSLVTPLVPFLSRLLSSLLFWKLGPFEGLHCFPLLVLIGYLRDCKQAYIWPRFPWAAHLLCCLLIACFVYS
jgi:hypothetical protein